MIHDNIFPDGADECYECGDGEHLIPAFPDKIKEVKIEDVEKNKLSVTFPIW